MKKWLPLFAMLLLVACSESVPTDKQFKSIESSSDSIQTLVEEAIPIEPNACVNELTEKQRNKLSKFLKKSTLALFDSLIVHLRFVKNDVDLETIYTEAEPLVAQMEKEMRKKQEDAYVLMKSLRFIDSLFAFRASCEAECTEFVLIFDLNDFEQLAKMTSGTRDDEFFRLKQFACGETAGYEPNWLTFFTRTWDYGGGVELGDGRIYSFLKDSWKFQKTPGSFNAEIQGIRNETIRNMAHPIYMKKENEVIAEIEKILQFNCLNSKEKKEVKDLFAKIKLDVDEPKIQYDCANKDCDWGG